MSNSRLAGQSLLGLLALLAAFEGRSLVAYLDPVGIPTICEGWTHGVQLGDVATPDRCDELTLLGIRQAEEVFDRWVPEWDGPAETKAAFVSFIYNVGPGGKGVKDGFVWLKNGNHSTMIRLLWAGQYAHACDQLPFWTKAGGIRFLGLERRRKAEQEMCHAGLRNHRSAAAGVRWWVGNKRLAA